MSLAIDGVWKAGVWATTVWADGVWREGPYVPPVVVDEPAIAGIGSKRYGLHTPGKIKRKRARIQRQADALITEAKIVLAEIQIKPDAKSLADVAGLSKRIQASVNELSKDAQEYQNQNARGQDLAREMQLQRAEQILSDYFQAIAIKEQKLRQQMEELDIVYVAFALLS